MQSEKQLQFYMKKILETVGCAVYKFASPTKRGVPDLIIIPPSGVCFFIELKSPTKKGKLTKLQEHQIKMIRARNVNVFVIDSKEGAQTILKKLWNKEL